MANGWSREYVRQLEARKRASDAVEGARLAKLGVAPHAVRDPHLRGVVATLRGRLAEERVVRVLTWPRWRPWWLIAARRADKALDETGIDILVHTRDAGVLHLQVKSCQDSAETWRRRHPELDRVGVVVAPPELEDGEVWGAAMGQLIVLREAAGA